MRKFLSIALSFALMLSLVAPSMVTVANAEPIEKAVATVEVTGGDGTMTVSGTVTGEILAVAIQVYDEDETEVLVSESTGVVESAFTYDIEIDDGTYVVKVADYDGGEWNSQTVTLPVVDEEPVEAPAVVFEDYTFGTRTSITAPALDADDFDDATVTYYYYADGGDAEHAEEWPTPFTSTTLDAGTYYVFAVITNIDDADDITTDPTEFVVERAAVEMNSFELFSEGYAAPHLSDDSYDEDDVEFFYYDVDNGDAEDAIGWDTLDSPEYDLAPGNYAIFAVIHGEAEIKTEATEFTVFKGILEQSEVAYVAAGATSVSVDLSGYMEMDDSAEFITTGLYAPSITGNITMEDHAFDEETGLFTATIAGATDAEKNGTIAVVIETNRHVNYISIEIVVLDAPLVLMSSYYYADEEGIPTPALAGADTLEIADVEFYYSETDEASDGTEWSTVVTTESLMPAKYYMYAVISLENGNEIVTETTEFDVFRRSVWTYMQVYVADNATSVTVDFTEFLAESADEGVTGLVFQTDGEFAPKNREDGGISTSNFAFDSGTSKLRADVSGEITDDTYGGIDVMFLSDTYAVEVAVTIMSFVVPSVSMNNVYYGVSNEGYYEPHLDGASYDNVTFYYNTEDSNEGGTLWTSEVCSSLEIGTYYMYAVIGADDNHPAATTETTSFSVVKALSLNNKTVSVAVNATSLSVDLSEYVAEDSALGTGELETRGFTGELSDDEEGTSYTTYAIEASNFALTDDNVFTATLSGVSSTSDKGLILVFLESEHQTTMIVLYINVESGSSSDTSGTGSNTGTTTPSDDSSSSYTPSSGSNSSSSSGSSSSGNQNGNGDNTKTNSDGSTTTATSTKTTTRNSDGSTTEKTTENATTTAVDGSKTEAKTETATTTKTTNGTTTETTTTTETATTTAADGTKTTAKTTEEKVVNTTVDANGNVSGTGTVTATTTTTAANGAVVSTTTTEGTVTVATDESGTVNTVTESVATTKDSEGNTIEVVETVATEAVAKDGSTSEVLYDVTNDKLLSAELNISEKAVTDAVAADEPIQAPITVPVSTDTMENTAAIIVNFESLSNIAANTAVAKLPEVEIQVTDGSYGTVAATRNADGTFTVIKETRMGSVIVPVSGKCELVIVDNSKDFTDVKDNAWYKNYVDFVTARTIFSGTGGDTFSPEMTMNRAMVAQVLYNHDRNSTASGEVSFKDVKSSDWFGNAVTWASKNNIVGGYSDEWYGAADAISRQDLVTILYRYAKFAGYDTTYTSTISKWSDAGNVASYAKDAVDWALSTGLIDGIEGTISPTVNASRAQVATIMTRFVNNAR